MNLAEGKDYSPEQFNRAGCIDCSLSGLVVPIHPFSNDLFERFLAEEPTKVAEEVKSLRDQNSLAVLTETQLGEMTQRIDKELISIGIETVARARELQMTSLMTEEGLARSLGREIGEYRGLKTGDLLSLIPPYGWEIMTNAKGGFALVVEDKAAVEAGFGKLEVASLDELYSKDPDFVKQQLKRYYLVSHQKSMTDKVRRGFEFHSLEPMIPEEIKLVVEEEREGRLAADHLIEFLILIGGQHESILKHKISSYQRELLNKRGRTPDGNVFFLRDYLGHMADCHGLDGDEKRAFGTYWDIYRKILSIDLRSRLLRPDENEEFLGVLSQPFEYHPFVLEAKQSRALIQRGRDRLFMEFLEKAAPAGDLVMVEQVLGETLPELAQRLASFKEFLGESIDGAGGSNFDKFVELAASLVVNQQPWNPENIDLAKVLRYSLDVYWPRDPAKDFEGIGYRKGDWYIHFPDSYFENLLFVIVLKVAREQFANHPNELKRESKDSPNRVIDGMQQNYQQKIKMQEEQLAEFRKKRRVWDDFVQQVGLNREVVDELVVNSQIHIHNWDWEHVSYDNRIQLELLLNTFFWAKRGLISIDSPALQAFLREIFPEAGENFRELLEALEA